MNPAIRSAREGDAPQLVELYRRSYAENAKIGFPSSILDCDEGTIEQWIRSRTVFVATHDEEFIGAVQMIPRPEWELPEIGRLAVSPDWQERGIGRTLLESVEEHVKSEGWGTVRLRTLSDHPFLEDWYRRCGYERVSVQRLDNRPYDAPILEKKL
ncbi:GNAT family N-acetyltransferase [Haladaptatus sp. AB643]|uniref:GNAT family N-acetyltransferase n=1 Tax=unclassified Haladaptatus TaxID=2622732 RepID=UPI00209C4A26|nr:GNAT family N-acetyltransferase [Haladaptatus sp. AB643]MCO8252408.1 GNAT family N-acetyltransferase [Haladaptatus sp. AB618]